MRAYLTVIKLFLSTVFLVAIGSNSFGQNVKYEKKYQKVVQRAEANFQYGDYYQGKELVRKLRKKYVKKQVTSTQNYVLLCLYETKYLVGLGRYIEVQDSLDNSMFYFNSTINKDSSKYGDALLVLTDIYSDYGNFVKAREYYDKAKAYYDQVDYRKFEVIDTNASGEKKKLEYLDPSLKMENRINDLLAKRILRIQVERGFYRESEGDYDNLIKYQASVTKREFSNVDTTLKSKTTKIKKKEFKKRQVQLASLYVEKADFLRLKGNYSKAASMYQENERLFERFKLNKKSFPYIKNQFGRTLMAENDGQILKPYKVYQKLKSSLDKSHQVSSYHKFYNEVVEQEIQSFIDADLGKKAKSLFLKYKLDNVHKYGKQSVYYLNALMLENKYSNRNKRYKKAIKKENELKEGIAEQIPNDHVGNLKFNDHFYDFYRRHNKIEEARIERETNEWIAGINFGEEAPRYSMAVLDLANFNIDMQDQFSDSKMKYEKHFDKVIDRQLHDHHPAYSIYLKYYSKLKAYLDKYNEAYAYSGRILKIANERFGPKSEEYGVAMIDLASLNIDRGEFDEAESQLETATEIIKEKSGKKSINYYLALMELAELYQIGGKYKKADATMKTAYKLLNRSGENAALSVNSSEELAELYIAQGRYKAAENILVRSIDLNERKYGDDHYRLVKPLSLYADLYLVTGEYIEAEKKVKRALELSKKTLGDTSVAYMDNLTLLAEIYVAMGNYDEAQEIYSNARKLIQQKFGKGNIREAEILEKLADVNFKSNDADIEVIDGLLDEAKDIIITNFSSSHPSYADLLEYHGRVYMEYGKFEEAESNVMDARKIWYAVHGKDHIKSARNEMLMGDLKYKEEKYHEAYENFKISSESFKNILDDNHPEYIDTRSKMGRSLFANGEYARAMKVYDETTLKYLVYLKKYFPSLSEKEKGKYWNSIKGDFEAYNTLALNFQSSKGKTRKSLGNIYSFKLSTKAILQSSSAKLKNRVVNSGDGDLIFRFGQFNEKKELLTKGLSMTEAERLSNGINMAELEKEINSLEKELSEESEEFAQIFDNEQYTWKDVKKVLKPNEYAVEIIRFRYWDKVFTDSILYAALILHNRSKAPELVLLSNGNELDAKFFKYYTNVIKYKAKDKKSYGQFWKAVDSYIPDSSTIYISADGVYNQMNIETLVDTSGTYIIDKDNVYYVSNTKDLVLNSQEGYKQKYETNSAFLIGNPKFAGDAKKIDMGNKVSSIEPLPGAEKEILNITKLLAKKNWKYVTLTQDSASELKVKNMESPRVFHVATHGFFMAESKKQEQTGREDIADNPLLRSGLLFTGAGELLANNNIYDFNKKDGILTAYEAMNLNLDNTELVVLSACETGRGEIESGEGVYGLQRSFLVAGADNVVMTLFKVNDKITQELMNDFYSHWLAGESKRSAFQEAKKRIKKKYEKPIYWGSFMMIGLD
ncbi:MAG: hypothetical protein CL840_09990 [Crocinitomicaceae bacterium]|nr:hypothetical protein [Crocinitomicaceae bacterium]|tara:strand:- start:20674 stop:25017 length:4344 start_codon:yes stop_codon:yes gene_type:complete